MFSLILTANRLRHLKCAKPCFAPAAEPAVSFRKKAHAGICGRVVALGSEGLQKTHPGDSLNRIWIHLKDT